MLPAGLQQLDFVTRVAPLGLRFVDDATGLAVGGGLSVEAYPPGHPELRRKSHQTPSGLHSLRQLSGLRVQESGDGDREYWESVSQRPFVVEVIDNERRYLPARFTALAPSRGVSGLQCASFSFSATGEPAVPLFSQPSREVPKTAAAVRAELWDAGGGPAAWALVEVSVDGGVPARGLADEEGRVAVFLPFPAPLGFVDDPEASQSVPLSGPPLLDQQWPCTVRAFWAPPPASPPQPSGLDPLRQLGALDVPDLCALFAQPAARLFPLPATPVAQIASSIRFGRDLVLRTAGDPRGRLLLTSP